VSADSSIERARPTVLLADSDLVQRSRLTCGLALAGYHVVELGDGAALRRSARTHAPGAPAGRLFLVIELELDPPDPLHILRTLVADGLQIPFAAINRRADAERTRQASELGAVVVLEGPPSAARLVHEVHRTFGLRIFAVRKAYAGDRLQPERRPASL
jgi:CheY-like chemotaxis protein